ncbi:MAG TPA: alkaline phosphatase family protein, partial [Kofleriaceae bacterium]|nr:alkaline phosphatase family protein [Kofleriaceae bacterium]
MALTFAAGLTACAADEPSLDSSAPIETARHDEGGIKKVKHVIVVMQENHSFDNYFGALAYAPGSPYHAPRQRHDDGDGDRDDRTGCRASDHDCVDGLTCTVDAAGGFQCANSNLDDDGSTVHAFHDANRCVKPDLDHGWFATHREANFDHPDRLAVRR